MKNSPASAVGSRLSGSPERSRTVKRHNSGRWTNRRATCPSSSASTESILINPPAANILGPWSTATTFCSRPAFISQPRSRRSWSRTAWAWARWRATCWPASPSAPGASSWSDTVDHIRALRRARRGVPALRHRPGARAEAAVEHARAAARARAVAGRGLGGGDHARRLGARLRAARRAASPAWRCRFPPPRSRSRRSPSAARSPPRAARAPSRCCCSRTSR